MSDAIDAKPFPRGVLMAAGALIAFTLAAALTARTTGIGSTHMALGEVTESRLITLTSLPGGQIRIAAVPEGHELLVAPTQKYGFIGVIMQDLARERMRAGRPKDAAIRLLRFDDGRIGIEDPETGHIVTPGAFGPDNLEAFAQLFSLGVKP
jgi:putative photosynthetic complex assembly protein